MFRWPLALTPLSLGSSGATRDATLEVTPRGAIFTLAALSHVGHPAHLALLDAYLKGQMRVRASAGIGEDSRLVASALAAPLVAAHELGIEQLGLSDLILLPGQAEGEQAREGDNGLGRAPESPRFLLRVPGPPERWLWVHAAERFEVAGCVGTPNPGLGSRWHDVIVQLPERESASMVTLPTGGLPPIDAELREPTATHSPSAGLVAALRALGQARFARATGQIHAAADAASRQIESQSASDCPLTIDDFQVDRRAASITTTLPPAADPAALASALAGPRACRHPVETALTFQNQLLGVSLTPDLDGYQTLCLLPPPSVASGDCFELMRDAAWEVIEALIGRPLAERRTEPIALRLIGADGRTTTLDIGASVVVVRNQIVFTAWIGADGRVMLKLFPAGGMPTQPT